MPRWCPKARAHSDPGLIPTNLRVPPGQQPGHPKSKYSTIGRYLWLRLQEEWGPLPGPPFPTGGQGLGGGPPGPLPHPKPSPASPQVRSRLLAPLALLPSTLGPVSSSSPCKAHQALPPQMSLFSSIPARNGGWGLGADLLCPEQGASPSLPSSSGLGLPALRAQNEASRQKRPGWQGQPASCGRTGTGRGMRLPEGRGQGHMSSWQIRCPPPQLLP